MESYFKSEEEKHFVQREINKINLANFVFDIITANAEYPHSSIEEFSWDNVENIIEQLEYDMEDYKDFLRENYFCGEDFTGKCDYTIADIKDALSEFVEVGDDVHPADYHMNEFIESLDEPEMQDIMQFFMVDRYIARKLSNIGEPILNAGGCHFWGRTCFGQSVELDGTFQKIFRGLK